MTRTAAFGALLGLVLLTPRPVVAGQAPPRDVAPGVSATGGVIKGVVTAAESGQPIRGAEVRLTGGTQRNQRPHGAMTDEAGRYEVTGLPPGQYTVTAILRRNDGTETRTESNLWVVGVGETVGGGVCNPVQGSAAGWMRPATQP